MGLSFATAPTSQTSTPSLRYYSLVSRRHSTDGILDHNTYKEVVQRLVHDQMDSSHAGSSDVSTSSPISALPVELLRDIFGYTTSTNRRQIVIIMGVCSAWRDVVLGITALFNAADWNSWPVEFLREWCHRAGQTGLEVRLKQNGIRRALVDAEYACLLNETSPRWQQLSLTFDRSGEGLNVHSLFYPWNCPQLHTLALTDNDDEGQNEIFVLSDNFAPALEELSCKDTHVIRAPPWEDLKLVTVNVDFWARGTQREDIFRTISHTDKLVFDGCSFSGIGGSNITLDGVKELVIVGGLITGFAEWPLRWLSFPHTTKLVLCGMRPYANEFPTQDKLLWNNAFPEVRSLTLQLVQSWFSTVLSLLSRDTGNDDTLWFPSLTTLALVLAYEWNDRSSHRLPRASESFERAVLRFLGTPSQHHRDALPMQNLFIRGITISEEADRRMGSLVNNVEMQADAFQFSMGN